MKQKLAALLVAIIDAAYQLVSPEPVPAGARFPTLGRLVYYHTGTDTLPALVTRVTSPGDPDSLIMVVAWWPDRAVYTLQIAHAPSGAETWCWPDEEPQIATRKYKTGPLGDLVPVEDLPEEGREIPY